MSIDTTTDILAKEQQTVEELLAIRPLTADNAVFTRTAGGFLSLDYTDARGEIKHYDRVAVHRCFPFSDPDIYISIRESEGDGREIGLIERLRDLPAATQALLDEQLALRYFMPVIERIQDIKEEYGYTYWDVLTDKGACHFTVRNGSSDVYPIGPHRYVVTDLDGNRFEIPDITRLTAREMKKLDLFI